MTVWIYAGEKYDSEADCHAAVTQMKNNLDNAPTTWCIVAELSGSAEDGWVVPADNMTDAEINAITDSSTSYYKVESIIDGDSNLGITATEANTKISEMRTRFANWKLVDLIIVEQAVTHEDMSVYL